MAIYNVHAGHNFNVSGASGHFSETEQDRAVKNKVIAGLQSLGHTVYDCTDESGKSQNANLANIVGKCNAHSVSLDISIHFNASNGAGHGVEVFCYDTGTVGVAQRICNNIATLGFKNRGVKYSKKFYVLNNTKAPAILIECCFCDNQSDADIYNADTMAQAIVKGITGQVIAGGGTPAPAPTPTPPAQPSTQPSTQEEINFTYEVKAGGKAYPPVTNLADYAGVIGVPITDVAISVDKGSIWYQVHVLGGGWLPPVSGCDWTDAKNGYAGNGKPIDAIRVYLNTPAEFAVKHGYKKAQYRLSPINRDYYSWQHDNETGNGQDGYAGCFGKEMDRFQVF